MERVETACIDGHPRRDCAFHATLSDVFSFSCRLAVGTFQDQSSVCGMGKRWKGTCRSYRIYAVGSEIWILLLSTRLFASRIIATK